MKLILNFFSFDAANLHTCHHQFQINRLMNRPIVESMVRSIGSIVVERHSYSMNVVLDSIVVVVDEHKLGEPVLFRATMNCHRLENLNHEQKN